MLAIVSHDAGAAEVLSSYVRRNRPQCVFSLGGPARDIFKRKLGEVANVSLPAAVSSAERLLCGSSWQSDLELDAIRLAKRSGTPCTAFVDHWTSYVERFTRSGATTLPDEIWVADDDAERIARGVFSDVAIRLVPNPYFEDIREELRELAGARSQRRDGLAVLYVCEPVREHALQQHGDPNYWGYTEEEALRYFLSNAAVLREPIERIALRPHPSEDRDKYSWVADEFELPIIRGGVSGLVAEIAASDVVVGCESMALVVGLLAGKRVISCVPPGGRPCALPQAEIQHLQELAVNLKVK
jgi:hypothetical protein